MEKSPQQLDAEREATKREAHKSPGLSHKRWAAVHDSVKGWHVALVDNHAEIVRRSEDAARTALRRGDLNGFVEAASDALMARVRASLSPGEPK